MSIFHIHKQKGRAQVAFEFTLFAMLIFVVFLAFLFAIRKELVDLNLQRDNKELQDVVNRVREEIFLASTVQDGYYREFRLPDKISRKGYSLSIANGMLIGVVADITLTAVIPDVIGTPQIGTNSINRTGGVIYLN